MLEVSHVKAGEAIALFLSKQSVRGYSWSQAEDWSLHANRQVAMDRTQTKKF